MACTSTRETSATGMRYIDSSLVPGRAHIKVLLQIYMFLARGRALSMRASHPFPHRPWHRRGSSKMSPAQGPWLGEGRDCPRPSSGPAPAQLFSRALSRASAPLEAVLLRRRGRLALHARGSWPATIHGGGGSRRGGGWRCMREHLPADEGRGVVSMSMVARMATTRWRRAGGRLAVRRRGPVSIVVQVGVCMYLYLHLQLRVLQLRRAMCGGAVQRYLVRVRARVRVRVRSWA